MAKRKKTKKHCTKAVVQCRCGKGGGKIKVTRGTCARRKRRSR